MICLSANVVKPKQRRQELTATFGQNKEFHLDNGNFLFGASILYLIDDEFEDKNKEPLACQTPGVS